MEIRHGHVRQDRLNAGAHRFYCAVAAGFTHVSAIDVTDDLL